MPQHLLNSINLCKKSPQFRDLNVCRNFFFNGNGHGAFGGASKLDFCDEPPKDGVKQTLNGQHEASAGTGSKALQSRSLLIFTFPYPNWRVLSKRTVKVASQAEPQKDSFEMGVKDWLSKSDASLFLQTSTVCTLERPNFPSENVFGLNSVRMATTTTTIQLLLEASTGRKPSADATKARELLYQPESLPCITVELDGATISVHTAPPSLPTPLLDEDSPSVKPPIIPATKGVSHFNDAAQISLRLGASVVDRSQCFDTVAQLFQALQSAVNDFNESNLNVAKTSISYRAVEKYYGAHSPGIPKIMRGDALTRSPTSTRYNFHAKLRTRCFSRARAGHGRFWRDNQIKGSLDDGNTITPISFNRALICKRGGRCESQEEDTYSPTVGLEQASNVTTYATKITGREIIITVNAHREWSAIALAAAITRIGNQRPAGRFNTKVVPHEILFLVLRFRAWYLQAKTLQHVDFQGDRWWFRALADDLACEFDDARMCSVDQD
ncbi:hypothetical protein BKA70DRAFT_1218600 [Coprinopsis sp. MPI-PUGE-AT-0042]|nr:hypothetical protein BKA70DRAFT_1218600 [Coprinopsis sp. MPI-PUGE-AT-0042]